jgi:hypothetical protein
MFRKTVLAVAAVATITAAALVPTAASAKGFKVWGGKYWGYGVGLAIAAPLVYGYSCWRWVDTPYGLRRVNVCY